MDYDFKHNALNLGKIAEYNRLKEKFAKGQPLAPKDFTMEAVEDDDSQK